MIVVIDTNVLLVSVSKKSKYHWLYKLILSGKLQTALSNEILTEYEEQFSKHWNEEIALNIVRSLAESPHTLQIAIHYQLNLITIDPDDNKFVDCAFASNADYIVTNDNHFSVLKRIDFPTIPTLNIDEFYDLLTRENL